MTRPAALDLLLGAVAGALIALGAGVADRVFSATHGGATLGVDGTIVAVGPPSAAWMPGLAVVLVALLLTLAAIYGCGSGEWLQRSRSSPPCWWRETA